MCTFLYMLFYYSFFLITIHHLLESIHCYHHRHTKVLCIFDLLPHVVAALLQQIKVLHRGTQTHSVKGYAKL